MYVGALPSIVCLGDVTLNLHHSNSSYSMMLTDTVIVLEGGSEKVTKACTSAWADVSYYLDDDEKEEPERAEPQKERSKKAGFDANEFGRRTTRSREQDKSKDFAAEEKRRKHQMELERQKREEVSCTHPTPAAFERMSPTKLYNFFGYFFPPPGRSQV